jgi:hypothetical protein
LLLSGDFFLARHRLNLARLHGGGLGRRCSRVSDRCNGGWQRRRRLENHRDRNGRGRRRFERFGGWRDGRRRNWRIGGFCRRQRRGHGRLAIGRLAVEIVDRARAGDERIAFDGDTEDGLELRSLCDEHLGPRPIIAQHRGRDHSAHGDEAKCRGPRDQLLGRTS